MWPVAAVLICGVVDQADGTTVRVESNPGPTLWLQGPLLDVHDGEALCLVRATPPSSQTPKPAATAGPTAQGPELNEPAAETSRKSAP